MLEEDRLQNILEVMLGPNWKVDNIGWPGARPLDYLMQTHQAITLGLKPDLIVADLSPHRFLPSRGYVRLDKRGDNLKWFRLEMPSREAISSLNSELIKKLVIHKVGLLFGFYDYLDYLFVSKIYWPSKQKKMGDEKRKRAILESARITAGIWDTLQVNENTMLSSGPKRDYALFTQDLKSRNLPLLVVLLPAGHPGFIERYFSKKAQENLDKTYEVTKEWLEASNTPYLDLYHKIPSEHYDDMSHIYTRAGNKIITDAIHEWMKNKKMVP